MKQKKRPKARGKPQKDDSGKEKATATLLLLTAIISLIEKVISFLEKLTD